MKYEKPELVTLTPAINAIQAKPIGSLRDGNKDDVAAYEDWE